MSDPRPIGVFDSGVGGITVLRAIHDLLPGEDLIYLGDTARLPYGTKSAETVVRYATQAANALIARDIKLLVIACNTASAVGTPVLAEKFAPVPVIGVVEPGAEAAIAASSGRHIAVIATEGTVRGGAYPRAIQARAPDAAVVQTPATVFVALAEEGWTDTAPTREAARAYLAPLFAGTNHPDTLVLGCTHFPVLTDAIRAELPDGVTLVDSATTTAQAVARVLGDQAAPEGRDGTVRFLATDGPERFARVGQIFFGQPINEAEIEIIDL
ncbi:glutamate racemase [Pyruvatibacter mobilis]|uniref:glutamate racemase n=1 Tax=Pyruvatibacter mobilis TaxID=1712261 RepID=UPI003BA90E9F